MDLSTTFLGMKLPHPLIVGASPLSDELDTVRQLEDAGAAAIVLRSLFEEQIIQEQLADLHYHDSSNDSSAEATTYFPDDGLLDSGPDQYLKHLNRVKQAVGIPVIASLNGSTSGGWLAYGRLMEQEGADALELNVYQSPLDPQKSSAAIELQAISMVQDVKRGLNIPVAVKLSPFFTSFAHFAVQLDRQGADGLVLFNRFYQVDIDVLELEVTRTLSLSDSSDLLMRLRGTAAVAPYVKASLAVSGGVHTALDVIKSVMAGAHATQMVSALLKNGPAYIGSVRRDLERWMEENEWESFREMRGNMGVDRTPDPQAYDRTNYMTLLRTWERV